MVDLRRQRKRHIVNSGIGMVIQCWLAGGALGEFYVSLLIRCRWDTGTGGRGYTHLRQIWGGVMDAWYF